MCNLKKRIVHKISKDDGVFKWRLNNESLGDSHYFMQSQKGFFVAEYNCTQSILPVSVDLFLKH